jgi:hypothetical protein
MKHKLSTNKGGQYIIAKWGKTRDSKFLEIEIVIDKDEFNVINVEVTSKVRSAVKMVKDLQDKRRSRSFMEIKLMTLMRFTRLGLRLFYGFRWRIESLFSTVKRTFGESVRATRHYMLTPLTNLWG